MYQSVLDELIDACCQVTTHDISLSADRVGMSMSKLCILTNYSVTCHYSTSQFSSFEKVVGSHFMSVDPLRLGDTAVRILNI